MAAKWQPFGATQWPLLGREEPVGLPQSKSTLMRIVRRSASTRALFSKDKHLSPGEPLFPASSFRKTGASGQPPVAQLEGPAHLRSNEPDKVPEVLVRYFHPYRTIW